MPLATFIILVDKVTPYHYVFFFKFNKLLHTSLYLFEKEDIEFFVGIYQHNIP